MTTAYIVPLFATPRGKQVAHDAQVQAEKLGSAAAENSKHLARQGQEKLSQGYTLAQDRAGEAKQYAGDTLASGRQTAAEAADSGRQTAANLTSRASNAASGTTNQAGNMLQGGSQTAADTSSRAQDLSSQGVQSVGQSAAQLSPATSDYIDLSFGAGNEGSGRSQNDGLGKVRGDMPEEILDHSKVKSDLSGGVEKVLF